MNILNIASNLNHSNAGQLAMPREEVGAQDVGEPVAQRVTIEDARAAARERIQDRGAIESKGDWYMEPEQGA